MWGRIGQVSFNSIRFKLVVGALSIILPLLLLMVYNNFYAIDVVRNQVADSNQDMISLYMQQVDDNLNNVDKYLAYLLSANTDLPNIESNENSDRYLAMINLNNKLTKDVLIYHSMDSLFVYSRSMEHFVEAYNEGRNYEELDRVKNYIENLIDKSSNTENVSAMDWFPGKIGQDYYIFRIYKTGDTYVGAWVNIKRMLEKLSLINHNGKGAFLFITDKGIPMNNSLLVKENNIDLNKDFQNYYISGNKDKYLVVGEKSKEGAFSLVALIPEEKILENLPYLQRIMTVFIIGFIILLPICLLFLRKSLLLPIKRIVTAMKQILNGNLDVRIKQFPTSDEFLIVNDTFNSMISQIQELKISVYEEQLNKQKAELQFLKLQIKPHFFLNSLNTIYSLIELKKYGLVQELILRLVQYYRYIMRSNETFVFLKEELKNINNYVCMHELRFPGSLTYSIEAPESLSDIQFPPMLIQTFVENTIKHAVTLDNPIHISIKININPDTPEPSLTIIIKDTGKGFAEDILAKLVTGKRIIDEKGEHIGIWNVQQRLRLLYGTKAQIMFANDKPTGSIVEILLPIKHISSVC